MRNNWRVEDLESIFMRMMRVMWRWRRDGWINRWMRMWRKWSMMYYWMRMIWRRWRMMDSVMRNWMMIYWRRRKRMIHRRRWRWRR